jgi:hypothetical protein
MKGLRGIERTRTMTVQDVVQHRSDLIQNIVQHRRLRLE